MRKKVLIGLVALITLLANAGAASACAMFGYQPPTP